MPSPMPGHQSAAPGLPVRLLQFLLLALAPVALYGNFLDSPLVFDDLPYLLDPHPDYLRVVFSLDSRWLPYATIEWTRVMLGGDMIWFRLGNLALHIANVFLLFLLLRRLFEAVIPAEGAPRPDAPHGGVLASSWLAFAGALIFAVHPVAVYGVAYLVQRTILMATLFALATWLLFLEGLVRGRQRWLLASVLAYLLAALSKEHAIMVPAVSAALFILLRKPDRQSLARVGPTFLLYGMAGAFIVFQIKTSGILGYPYEPNGVALLSWRGIAPEFYYPLSVLSQSFLYFKYLWLWLVPDPAWMSVDMLENFATRLWTWPESAGLAGFVVYPIVAMRLLLLRGRKGLLGFAMLCPWLLFATELSSVRIQEIFVLYRSYLWMPCIFAALPFLLQKVPARYAAALFFAAILAVVPATWNRLTVFADPILLWDDALQLALKRSVPGTGRIYHNRGVAYLNRGYYPQAIQDFDDGIMLLPGYSELYNDRAVAYLKTGKYDLALRDYDMAIRLKSNYYNPYLGRAEVLEALGNPVAARRDYEKSCMLGVAEACDKSAGD